MSRTSATEVKKIIETDIDDSDIEAYISDANNLITDILSDTGMSESRLTTIEKWFTAHLLACSREKQARREALGDAEITYQGSTAMDLDSTMYGQQVRMFDTSGKLYSEIGKKSIDFFTIEGTGGYDD